MEWISVEDRLPKSKQAVDVFCVDLWNKKKKRIINAKYTKTYGFDYTEDSGYPQDAAGIENSYKVTHWMPLPAPPKQEG
ncbi:DUF551 domain-containing protein [bacterium]|nr:DUF551 domain-containing protein [bacterium]